AVASRDQRGAIVKWFGTNTDIQELRDAQEATARLNQELERRVRERTEELRAANDRLRTVALQLETAQRIANVGSWELDLATGQPIWSDELFRIFGLDPRERPPSMRAQASLFEPESWRRVSEAIARSASTGEGYEITLEVRHKDGEMKTAVARAEA